MTEPIDWRSVLNGPIDPRPIYSFYCPTELIWDDIYEFLTGKEKEEKDEKTQV